MRDDYTRLFKLRGRYWVRALNMGIPWVAIVASVASIPVVVALTSGWLVPYRLAVIVAVGALPVVPIPGADDRRLHELAASSAVWAFGWLCAGAARLVRPRLLHVAVRAWRNTR
jgi:hypothetical protein